MKYLNQKHAVKYPPYHWYEWFEFFWLLVSNPTFQHSADKRRAYYEYRLGKHFQAFH